MDNQGVLPPLPPSDPGSLGRNHYDHFYNRSSRSFWKDASIEYIKTPMEKCKHYFEQNEGSYICKKCHFGLQGGNGLTSTDGKLFYQGQPIPVGA